MTNPPQNPIVRETLIQELEENGVLLKAPSWPPKAPNLKGIGQPTEPPRCRNPSAKVAQDLARKHRNWTRDGDTKRLAKSVPRPQSCSAVLSKADSGLGGTLQSSAALSLPRLSPASGPSPQQSPGHSPRNGSPRSEQRSSRLRSDKNEAEFVKRANRMVSRWSGERQTGTPDRSKLQSYVRSREDEAARGRVKVLGRHIVEPQRQVPILDRCEVLVVGAGPAGLSAALGARRAGADVMLLERYGCFGGTITTVGMETLGWYRYEGTEDCEGIGREMERVAERMGGTTKWPYNDSDCLDAEKFKLVADNLIKDATVSPSIVLSFGAAIGARVNLTLKCACFEETGVRPILHIWVVEVLINEDNQIYGVITDQSLGVTTVFNAVNVDVSKFKDYTDRTADEHLKSPYLDREFEKAAAAGVIPQDKIGSFGGSWSALSEAGEATNLNLVHKTGVDATCVRSLTDAEMEGRQNVMHALEALRHTELLTVAQVSDLLVRRKVAAALDMLVQRAKSLEATLRGGHYSVSRQLELVNAERVRMAEPAEQMEAARSARDEFRNRSATPSPASSWEASALKKAAALRNRTWDQREQAELEASRQSDKAAWLPWPQQGYLSSAPQNWKEYPGQEYPTNGWYEAQPKAGPTARCLRCSGCQGSDGGESGGFGFPEVAV
eukprot:g16373.t1